MCSSVTPPSREISTNDVLYRLKEMLMKNLLEHSNLYVIVSHSAIRGDRFDDAYKALEKAEELFVEAAEFSWNELDHRSSDVISVLAELQTKLHDLRSFFAPGHRNAARA